MTVPTKRNTRQRTAILDFLKTRKEFISAKDLYAEMGTSNIGLSTIYRALSDLVNDGDLDVFIDNDGESRFRLCGSHHHHHLLCRKCGKSVEFQAPEPAAPVLRSYCSFTPPLTLPSLFPHSSFTLP